MFSGSPALVVCLVLGACSTAALTPSAAPVVTAPEQSSAELESLVTQATQALEDDRPADALIFANEALRRQPFELTSGLIKVEAHLALGDRVSALSFAERLSHTRPRDGAAHYVLGKSYMAVGRALLALGAFERALAQDTDNPAYELGLLAAMALVTRYELGHLDGLATRIVQADPTLELAVVHQLAIAHEQRGDLVKARSLYERAAQSGDPLVHYNLARLLHDVAGLDAARPHYQRFLASDRPAWRRLQEDVRASTQRE